MSPLSTNFASEQGEPTQRVLDHYDVRAAGGVGLVIVEGTCVHPTGRGFINQLGVFDDSFVPGLRTLAQTIKSHGPVCLLQLYHGGRQANPKITGTQPLAPSAVACPISRITPKEMSLEDIDEIQEAFAEAARRARDAGFDGVELHAAHEYLLSEFLSPYTNKRTDRYGGSLENRGRMLLETVRRIRERVGSEFILSVRINGDDYVEGGLNVTEAIQVGKALEKEGVDLLNVSGGVYITPHLIISPLPLGPGVHIHLSAALKSAVKIPVIGVGRITTPEFAEKVLAEEKADLVALGRALLVDPEWPKKARDGRSSEIRPCLGCNQGCVDRLLRQKDITCTVNAAVGQDRTYSITASKDPKTVVVVGGGPAGMETARVAALRGHRVILYEKSDRLGGQLNLACISPHKESFYGIVRYLENQMKSLNISIHLGCIPDVSTILKHHPDVVVLATGSVLARPPIPGLDGARVVGAHDVLAGRVKPGQKVVVLGGGMTGCETAHFLSVKHGRDVTIIEQLPKIGQDIGPARRSLLFQELKDRGVRIMTGCTIQSIDGDRVRFSRLVGELPTQDVLDGIDTFVNALGVRPCDPLSAELKGMVNRLEVIGDACSPKTCLDAIAHGARIGYSI